MPKSACNIPKRCGDLNSAGLERLSVIMGVPTTPHHYSNLNAFHPFWVSITQPVIRLPNKGAQCFANPMEKKVWRCPHISGIIRRKHTRNSSRFQDAPELGIQV
jgi:hypothetical protein